MIVLFKICVNDMKQRKQIIRTVAVTGSDSSNLFHYLYMDKKCNRITTNMIMTRNLLPINEIELIKANPQKIIDYINKAILQFNKGNINISKYPLIKKMIYELKEKYGKFLPLEEINEPFILAEKYRIFK